MTEQEFYDKSYKVMRHPLFVILMFIFGWYLYLYGIAETKELPMSVQMSLGFGGIIIGYIMGAVMEKFVSNNVKDDDGD